MEKGLSNVGDFDAFEGSELGENNNIGENTNLENSDTKLDNPKLENNSKNEFVDDFPENRENDSITSSDENGDVFVDDFPEDTNSIDDSKDVIDDSSVMKKSSYEDLQDKRGSGGSYKDVKDKGWGHNDSPKCEVHHMPAKSVSPLSKNEGPAIAMEASDHRQTASCGSSREAKEYQAAQKTLIEEGKMEEAIQMDIDDLKGKFDDKYDKATEQMLEYAKNKNYI